MRFKPDQSFEHNYVYRQVEQTPESLEALRSAPCIGRAASLLSLINTGMVLEPGTLEKAWGDLHALAAEFGASPDIIQQLLIDDEPSLAPPKNGPSFYDLQRLDNA